MATLCLHYDDRYTFEDDILEIQNSTGEPVLWQTDISSRCTAVGIGTAAVTLKNGKRYQVTVTPADLSVALILGQSNAEGSSTDQPEVFHRNRKQSVANEEGQVYSTYAWSTKGHALYCAGIETDSALTVDSASDFVAKSLTSSQSRSGKELEYPLNSLSVGQKGKTGFDSGLAWQWHQQTGEKIWVVNCAEGSSAIESWLPGERNFEECRAIVRNVCQTLDGEVAAGHYQIRHILYFWLQGESNAETPEAEYKEKFRKMHNTLTAVLAQQGYTLDYGGIIMVRTFVRTNDARDIADNGPRLAQKAVAAEPKGDFATVHMACAVNDLWVSPEGVAQYWETKYPNSQYPFSCSAESYRNPTTIEEVHNRVHYNQPGYNEIGMVCAHSAWKQLFGNQELYSVKKHSRKWTLVGGILASIGLLGIIASMILPQTPAMQIAGMGVCGIITVLGICLNLVGEIQLRKHR